MMNAKVRCAMPPGLGQRVARRLPIPLKQSASRARQATLRFILRWQRRASNPGRFSVSLKQTLNLLYPEKLPADLHLDETALAAAGSLRVHDLQAFRRILAALDGPSAPSPVHVRFGMSDVGTVEVNGLRLILDRADNSVSQDILGERGYEPEVTQVLEDVLRPGMTFVDVGANVGYHALLASRLVGANGRVIAVEPLSENCRSLLMSMSENCVNNLTLLPVALDDHQGWAHFSTHIGSNASLVSDSVEEIARGYGTIVPTFRLDDLVVGPVDVMKIDIEGAEARAVAGASGLISECRPIVVTEVSEEMLGRVSGSSIKGYLEWFMSRDYSVFLLDRFGGRPEPVADVDHFLSSWNDPLRIENLLLLPIT